MEVGIYGCVTNPGKRDIRGTRVSVAIALQAAGGVKQKLATGIVIVKSGLNRMKANGTRTQFDMRKHPRRGARLFLRNGDVIIVQFNGARLLRTWQAGMHDR